MNQRFLKIIREVLSSLFYKLKHFLSLLTKKLSALISHTSFKFIKTIFYNLKEAIKINFKKILDFIQVFIQRVKIDSLKFYLNNYFICAFSDFYHSIIKKKKNVVILISLIFIFFIWSGYYSLLYSRYSWEGPKLKKITLQPGLTLDNISELLAEKEIIPSSMRFKLAIKILGKENQIYAGTYFIRKGLNNLELSVILTSPDYLTLGGKGKITIPEGFRIKQIASLLEKDFNMSQEKFIKETENDSLIKIIGLNGKVKNLEGFLYPDTYIVPLDADEKKIVQILFDNFLSQVYLNPEIQQYTSDNPKKLLDLIILASIVQAETAIQEEYPIIAGVYINRLKKNIKLQADPTIQYILPDGPRRLLNKDYKIESPYNTYIHNGLPPGPINNPGLQAIRSCIKPAEHDYFFFVAKKDKTHKFSKTYEEHLQAINEIRGN